MLQQLADMLMAGADNHNDGVTKLVDQFYDILPHKEEHRVSDWTLRQVVGKQDMCQVRDLRLLIVLVINWPQTGVSKLKLGASIIYWYIS